MAQLRLRLLGGFELHAASGEPVSLPPKKARALLAYLALTADRPQSRDRLATLLWEDADEAQARTSLRQALTAIRKSLADVGADVLSAGTETVRLDTSTMEIDALEFVGHAQSADPGHRELAAGLYRGHLLDGMDVRAPAFEDWLRAERERLRNLVADALAALIDQNLKTDNHGQALAAATQLLALDPLREDVHREAMHIFVAQGRHAAALEQYRRCREILRLELGVPPEPETERLYREILQYRHTAAASTEEPDTAPERLAESQPAARAADAPQLRHATVFLTDISGITAFADSADPEDLHDFLLRYRELVRARVRQYGGTVTNYIGSRLMAVFGVPVAHGNDAERAILAAMAIRDSVPKMQNAAGRRLESQIGVAGGRVLASQDDGGTTLTGGPVSVAARIMEGASPGEIRITGEIRETVGERLRAELLPGMTIAGIENPPPIWRVESLRRGFDGNASARPFIGREIELRQLGDMLENCLSTQSGRVVLMRGDAGIGKSRLMEELASRARSMGFETHMGQIVEFGGDPLSMLIRNLIGAGPNTDAEQAAKALEHAPVTPELRRFLADMSGLQSSASRGAEQDMDGSRRQSGRQAALKELVRSLASRQPLLIVVEDIHSATPLTMESLAWIASATRGSRTILAMTSRTEGDPVTPAWRNASTCSLTTLDLGPLSESEALQMAARYQHGDGEFARTCVQRADGNPLFLDQLLRAGQTPGAAVPGSLQNLILSRLDRLDAGERQALQVASVLGLRFRLDALRHLLGNADYSLSRMEDQGLLRGEAAEFLFAHALIQEAVYGSLLRSRRLELHTAAARWYSERDVVLEAHHLGAAGSPAAFAAYMRAARTEAASYRIGHALELIGRALAFAIGERDRCDLFLLRGELQRDHGQTAESVQSFGESLHLAQDDGQRLRAWIGIAGGLRILDIYDRALSALVNAERLALALGERKALINIYSLRGNVYFPLGDIESCLRAHEEARRLATEIGAPADEARALGGLGDAYYQNARIITARGYFERCIALAREHGLARVEINNLPMLGVMHLYCNEFEQGAERCMQALQMASRIGDLRSEALSRVVLANLYHHSGRNAESYAECEQALQLSRRLGAARFEADALTGMGMASLGLGKPVEARRLLDQAHALVEQIGPNYTGPWVLGAIAIASDDTAVRRKALAEGEAQLALGCVSHNYFHFYNMAIDVALELGEWAEAERYAGALERYTAREPLPWTNFVIARGRALARFGRNERGDNLRQELLVLRDGAAQSRLQTALPRIEASLAAF
ncbi:MAG TPA: BTAD domain-containing putative transcriptional regulator [Burkholderiales bacterium]